MKQETIPRLELLATLILALKVTLAWIEGEEREWKPFVQNRVNEIRTLVPVRG